MRKIVVFLILATIGLLMLNHWLNSNCPEGQRAWIKAGPGVYLDLQCQP